MRRVGDFERRGTGSGLYVDIVDRNGAWQGKVSIYGRPALGVLCARIEDLGDLGMIDVVIIDL